MAAAEQTTALAEASSRPVETVAKQDNLKQRTVVFYTIFLEVDGVKDCTDFRQWLWVSPLLLLLLLPFLCIFLLLYFLLQAV